MWIVISTICVNKNKFEMGMEQFGDPKTWICDWGYQLEQSVLYIVMISLDIGAFCFVFVFFHLQKRRNLKQSLFGNLVRSFFLNTFLQTQSIYLCLDIWSHFMPPLYLYLSLQVGLLSPLLQCKVLGSSYLELWHISYAMTMLNSRAVIIVLYYRKQTAGFGTKPAR